MYHFVWGHLELLEKYDFQKLGWEWLAKNSIFVEPFSNVYKIHRIVHTWKGYFISSDFTIWIIAYASRQQQPPFLAVVIFFIWDDQKRERKNVMAPHISPIYYQKWILVSKGIGHLKKRIPMALFTLVKGTYINYVSIFSRFLTPSPLLMLTSSLNSLHNVAPNWPLLPPLCANVVSERPLRLFWTSTQKLKVKKP